MNTLAADLETTAGVFSPVRAVLLRELRAALLNRYFQVFSVLALGGGIAAVVFSEEEGSTAFSLLQIAMYFVTLFALLAGVSSAGAESEEWPIFFAQPAPRWATVLGKFATLTAIFSGVLALLFAPAWITGNSPGALVQLYLQTVGLVAVFAILGLFAGFLVGDRVQGLVVSVCLWLFLLFGVDLIALFIARWPALQKAPDAWVGLLMVNPLDAFRIQALFALEQIPAETANKTPVAHWWLSHAGLWFATIATTWTAGLLLITSRRVGRLEV